MDTHKKFKIGIIVLQVKSFMVFYLTIPQKKIFMATIPLISSLKMGMSKIRLQLLYMYCQMLKILNLIN